MSTHHCPSVARNAELLKNGTYSDFTLECAGLMFHLHKAIVCPLSEVLAAMLDGRFLEGVTGKIKLEEDDPEMIAKMLDFVYCDTYLDERKPGSQNIAAKDHGTLLTHTKLYILGDKYRIAPLKKLALSKYTSAVAKEWNRAGFSASVKLMYAETVKSDRALKDIALKAALTMNRLQILFRREDFQALVLEMGEVGRDIMALQLKKVDSSSAKTGEEIIGDYLLKLGDTALGKIWGPIPIFIAQFLIAAVVLYMAFIFLRRLTYTI